MTGAGLFIIKKRPGSLQGATGSLKFKGANARPFETRNRLNCVADLGRISRL
jgi:hypothetical protein